MSEQAMDDIIIRHNRLMDDMRRAIAEGVLSRQDKDHILARTEELRTHIQQKGKLTSEEQQVLHKIEVTYNLIMKIEKEYLNQYINYLHKN